MNILGDTHDTLDDLPDSYEIKELVHYSLNAVNFSSFFGSKRSQFEREMGGAIHEHRLNREEAKTFTTKVAEYVKNIAQFTLSTIDTNELPPPAEAVIGITIILTDLLRGRNPFKPNVSPKHTKNLIDMIQKFAKASKQFPSGRA